MSGITLLREVNCKRLYGGFETYKRIPIKTPQDHDITSAYNISADKRNNLHESITSQTKNRYKAKRF